MIETGEHAGGFKEPYVFACSATPTSGYSFTNLERERNPLVFWNEQSGFNYNERTNYGDGDFHS